MIPEPGSLDLMLTNGLDDVTGSVGTTFIIEIRIIAIGHFFLQKELKKKLLFVPSTKTFFASFDISGKCESYLR